MVAPSECGYTVSKLFRRIDESINLDEPMDRHCCACKQCGKCGRKLGTVQIEVWNIHVRVPYHFVGNSMLIKINITCNDRYSILKRLL